MARAASPRDATNGSRVFGVQDEMGTDLVTTGPHSAHIRAEVRARVDEFRDRIARGEIRVSAN